MGVKISSSKNFITVKKADNLKKFIFQQNRTQIHRSSGSINGINDPSKWFVKN